MKRSTTLRGMTWMLLALPLVGCQVEEGGAVSSTEQSVQWEAMSGQFEVAQDGSWASQATGAVRVPMYRKEDGKPLFDATGKYPVRGTCGVTFISPRYAITAGHCAGVPHPETDIVTVETYSVGGVDETLLKQAGEVTGIFPDYQRALRLEDQPGVRYHVKSYQCSFVSRCKLPPFTDSNAPNDSDYQCGINSDLAMLYCPERDHEEAWLHVAATDLGENYPVEMYWFHEVLLMPMAPGIPGDPPDRFEHYTKKFYTDPYEYNFHYLEADPNLLLPLKSVEWSPAQGGGQRMRLDRDWDLGGFWTDLFACHGTSGSGVLQRNDSGELELLGPVIRPGGDWGSSRLCNNPAWLAPGQHGLSYQSTAAVQLLVDWRFKAEIDEDRRYKGYCGCADSELGNVCTTAFNNCEPGYGPHCKPQFENPPATECGVCRCE